MFCLRNLLIAGITAQSKRNRETRLQQDLQRERRKFAIPTRGQDLQRERGGRSTPREAAERRKELKDQRSLRAKIASPPKVIPPINLKSFPVSV